MATSMAKNEKDPTKARTHQQYEIKEVPQRESHKWS